MQIKRVECEQDANICDKFLNELINYESGLDNLINSKFIVKGFYVRALGNENKYLALYIAKDEPVGFVYAFKQHTKDTSFRDNVIVIDGLFIKDGYRKMGIGSALIKSVEDWALQTFGSAYLEINYICNNFPAENCYKKLGFSPIRQTLRKNINKKTT